MTLYYGEPDFVGHNKGPDHPDRKTVIQQIDRTVGYLRDAISWHGLDDSLDVVITSDHGMTTVKKRPLVDEIVLNKYLNLMELASFEILDYGGFGIVTPQPGKDQEVYDALSNAPNLTVYKKQEIPESFHLGRSKRLPPIVVVADLGFNLNSVRLASGLVLHQRIGARNVRVGTVLAPVVLKNCFNINTLLLGFRNIQLSSLFLERLPVYCANIASDEVIYKTIEMILLAKVHIEVFHYLLSATFKFEEAVGKRLLIC